MTSQPIDIRWEQRFSNFRKALQKLSTAVEIMNYDKDEDDADFDEEKWNAMNELQKKGLVQRFEYTRELA